jgi:Fic family protein
LLLLYHSGYEVGRYISLERIFEQSKDSYYESLEASSRRWHEGLHDAHPWLDYFWGVLLRAYREFEERVGQIATGRGAKSEQVRRAIRAKNLPFSISELERDCPGVSRELIRKVLREMRDAGELEAHGTGPAARWRHLNVQ